MEGKGTKEMSDKMRWILGVGIFLCVMAVGILEAPVSSYGAEKDATSISTLEKKMLAPTTKRIQYRKGKIRSTSLSVWGKAKKIDKTAKKLTIDKKGWYTLCVTTNKGKSKLSQVYFYMYIL